MSTQPTPVVLDTNILVHLIRANDIGKCVSEEHNLLNSPIRPIISFITVGEILSIAQKFGWGRPKQDRLEEIVRNLVIVHINQGNIVRRYAELDYFLEKVRKPANPIGQNDIWIAATAAELGAPLMTTDGDFDALAPNHLSLIRIHAKTGATL